MQKVSFFLPSDSLNDATKYYCHLIEKGFDKEQYTILRTDNKKGIEESDVLVCIRPGDLFSIKKKPKRIITWFQGIGPEEYVMLHGNTLKTYIVKKILEFVEKKALKKSDICLFVSDAMQKHYEKKYQIILRHKSIVIPCYNKLLDVNFLKNEERYKRLHFVYAGGLFSWQCIEKTLQIFNEIYKKDNAARLTILTGDKVEAERLINKYQVKNAEVKYVTLQNLLEELSKYKYAFLIREDHIVNNVSTPTKMNSYLAAGLIPIYTNVIDDFESKINLKQFGIKFSKTDSFSEYAQRILEHHKMKINTNEMMDCYQFVFKNYYNDEKYIDILLKNI